MSGLITGGASNSHGKNVSEQEYDSGSIAINQARRAQMQGLIDSTGGLSTLARQAPRLAAFSKPEMNLLGQLRGLPGQSIANPYEQQGIEHYQRVLQPGYTDALIGRGQNVFEQITAPTIQNQLTASGMGRSGAMAEALAQAGTQMALPLTQAGMADQNQAAGALLAQGGIFDQRQMERLQAALQAASAPRLAQYEARIQTPQNLLLQLLTGMPNLSPTTGAYGREAAHSWNFGLCWLADATLDIEDARFARYYINVTPMTFVKRVYALVGPTLAKGVSRSRVLQRLIRPVFARLARKGRAALGVA